MKIIAKNDYVGVGQGLAADPIGGRRRRRRRQSTLHVLCPTSRAINRYYLVLGVARVSVLLRRDVDSMSVRWTQAFLFLPMIAMRSRHICELLF